MKILEINSVCGIRSTGRICTDLADVLADEGHSCRVAYGRETVPAAYRNIAVRIGGEWDVRLHALLSRVTDRAGFYSKAATEKFLKWVDEYNPDLVHLHNIHGYYLHIPTLFGYLKEKKIPVVWTLHDCWAFTGHCAHYTVAGCDRWLTSCHDCPQKKDYPSSILADTSAKNYRQKKELFTGFENMTLVTPSYWLAEQVRQSFLKDYPVKVFPNGIDLSVFKPTKGDFRARFGLENKRIVLGVASAWSERKGLYDFVKLAGQFDENCQIVLVGLSEKQKAELPKNIIGITRTDSAEELAEIYTTADVFLNPSREETMGLTTLEAMACGTPVAVYSATALPEIVTQNTGVVLAENNVASAKAAVQKILAENNFSAEDCVCHAAGYGKETAFQKYIDLYKELVL